MKTTARTVSEYLQSVPADRRVDFDLVRATIKNSLPDGYEEVLNWGMITYEIPLATYPETYNKKPLMYAALANQKNYMSVYLCGVYCVPGQRKAFLATAKKLGYKLNMGKSCIRFKQSAELPLDLIAKTVGGTTVDEFIEFYKASRA